MLIAQSFSGLASVLELISSLCSTILYFVLSIYFIYLLLEGRNVSQDPARRSPKSTNPPAPFLFLSNKPTFSYHSAPASPPEETSYFMSPPNPHDHSTLRPPPPEMSSATRSLLQRVRQIVPPMLAHFHKGQLGRIAVIGGSADYTGAPYFSAMASARLGCDMSYVFCEPSAASTIKGYSPNLMVSPILRSLASLTVEGRKESESEEELAKPILDMLGRLHVLVIGPGLGRDKITQRQVSGVIKAARKMEKPLPLVLDADALWLVQNDPELVRGNKDVILTPNVIEFARLAKAAGVDPKQGKEEEVCKKLSNALGGVCIIQKGQVDYISNGEDTWVGDLTGGLKRSGGQGDTLTGSLGTFLGWREAYHEGLWDENLETAEKKLSRGETLLLAAFGGSCITRECSRRAFVKNGRALQASDLTDEVHGSFLDLLGEPEGDWEQVTKEGPTVRSTL